MRAITWRTSPRPLRLIAALVMVSAIALPGRSWSAPPVESPPSPTAADIPGLLTLTEAIKTGLTRNPLIHRSRYTSLGLSAVAKQVHGQQYPWIEASAAASTGSLRIVTSDGKIVHDVGGHGFDPGGALPHHNQNMLTGGLLLNQLITDFGTRAHRIQSSDADVAASKKDILINRALVILSVQRAYLTCLMQQRLVDIAAETLKRRQSVQDQVQTLYKRQLRAKLDLDLIQVEVANAELALVRARNDLAMAYVGLNHAMGIGSPAPLRLEPISVAVETGGELPDMLKDGLAQRPELLTVKDRIQASDELLRAAQALHFGSLSAVGTIGVTQYGDVHDSGIPADGFAPFWGVGATMRLPIFTGFQITNQIKEASHRKGEVEQDLEQQINEVILEIVRAYLAQTSNAQQISLEMDRVNFAKEAMQLAEQRYRLGISPIVEVIRATTMLFEAEARLVQAQYIYKTSQAALGYATGREYQKYEAAGTEGG